MLLICCDGCLAETGHRRNAVYYLLVTARRGRPTVCVNFRRSCSDVTCVLLLVVCPALCHNSIVACVNNFGVNNTGSIMAEGENPAGIFKGKDRLCRVLNWILRQQKHFGDTNSRTDHSRIRMTLDEDFNLLFC